LVTLGASASGGLKAPPRRSPWDNEDYWAQQELFAGNKRPPRISATRRAALDPRGAFVALTSAVVLISTGFAWYKVAAAVPGADGPNSVERSVTLFAHGYGQWRSFIPALAGVAVVAGVTNWLLRPGDRGALFVFVTLRLAALCLVGLTIAAMVVHAPRASDLSARLVFSSSVLWPVWVAVGASVVGFVGSLASGLKRT
jgi:hypothetical protein